jgi:hypothetical protein
VDEESQRDEMNAAIRAQRERGAVPRSMLPPEDDLPAREESPPQPESPEPEPEPVESPAPEPAPPKRGFFSRLLGR